LLNGATLCLYNLRDEGIGNLADWLVTEEITIYFSIPIVFRQFVGAFTGKENFPHLRLIQLGSDSVTLKEVQEYRKHFSPKTILVVRLGSTETGTVRRCFVDRENPLVENMVPVGYPIEDMEVSLLDEEGKAVGADCVGEIAVRSRYLSPGYWRMADLTQAKFLSDPTGGDERTYLSGDLGRMLPDGCLYHLGRKDFQVKVRGHRIEVAEIEATLLSLASIKETIVAPWEDHNGEQRLVAYLVPNNGPPPSAGELRSMLQERLPDYMVPSAFLFLDSLSLGPNGKLDRRALPAPDLNRPGVEEAFVAPRNSVEETLARIWADVLGLERVGIDDNLFALGSHSLIATQAISRIRTAFRVELPLRAVFENPTVAGLARQIINAQVATETPR
jgi:acyl-coenzyme A synthetase/AMP-(fatty) acid ligase/acyl carrier protein